MKDDAKTKNENVVQSINYEPTITFNLVTRCNRLLCFFFFMVLRLLFASEKPVLTEESRQFLFKRSSPCYSSFSTCSTCSRWRLRNLFLWNESGLETDVFLAKHFHEDSYATSSEWIAIVINHRDEAMSEAISHRFMKITNIHFFFVKVCNAREGRKKSMLPTKWQ